MKKIKIYTDGGSRGNPGKAAVGVVFYNEKKESIKKYSEYLGDNFTNNEAEYHAVILALKKFKHVFGKKIAKISEIELNSDSELLVKQLNGKYKVLNDKIQPLFLTVWNLRTDFKSVKFKHILRGKNTVADALANEALDAKEREKKLF